MPVNVPALLVPFQLILYPRLVVPTLTVKDIRHLNFHALRQAGYRGAVFDKDNCLNIPHEDKLVHGLEDAWSECKSAFGERNVVVVSNSAGSHVDDGHIQAESVQHHLGVHVLTHLKFKPSYSCIGSIRQYFSALPDPVEGHELVIVGDRIFTDVVMANRMRQNVRKRDSGRKPQAVWGPLAVWTSGVWQREATGIRWLERGICWVVEHCTTAPDTSVNGQHLSAFLLSPDDKR
ncbi:hypothetical protein FISHEDRAFT_74031 [Fistulina hepatica ATCC 64428]|uniref:HAD-superfamily phosphatase n=1 Tax=Fistulina hepatica ATCC 64428 TaxID=1128425 RepID=A0A0D7ADT8_9AGAR|nr:hypothetical protein FISHEDRAFT_74031 [Fistulina hepatica ATCC 64428]